MGRSKKHVEARETAAEERSESPAVERAEKKKGLELANGGIAAASDKLNLKPSPGGNVPSSDHGHRMSPGMKSSLKGYRNI